MNLVKKTLLNNNGAFLNKCCIKTAFAGKYKEKPEDTKFSALYFNDMHGKKATAKLAGLASGVDSFMKQNNDGFVICTGDTLIGRESELGPKNKLLINFLNYLSEISNKHSRHENPLICALGNHELDSGEVGLVKILVRANFKVVATNLHLDDDSPIKACMDKTIFQSIVAEKNGHYYGFIGALPTDLRQRVSGGIDYLDKMNIGSFDKKSLPLRRKYAKLLAEGCDIDYIHKQQQKLNEKVFKDTVKQLQNEVNRLTTEDGVNKIILVSHLGFNKDIEAAKNTTGIDVIIGGHSHTLIDGVAKGVNLVVNKE